MQLIEYLLWNHQTCDDYNKNISVIGLLLNHLQPIILTILIYYYNNDLFKKNSKYILLFLIFYILMIYIYTIQYQSKDKCTLPNEFNHLEWKWNLLPYNTIIYIYFLFFIMILSFLGFNSNKQRIFLVSFIFLSFLISKYIYDKKRVVGALWCFYAVFLPFLWYTLRINNYI